MVINPVVGVYIPTTRILYPWKLVTYIFMVDLPSVTYEVNVALVKLTVNHVGETLG